MPERAAPPAKATLGEQFRITGEVLTLLRQGLEGAPRTRHVEEIRGEFTAIDTALPNVLSTLRNSGGDVGAVNLANAATAIFAAGTAAATHRGCCSRRQERSRRSTYASRATRTSRLGRPPCLPA